MADWDRVGRTPSEAFVAAMERAGRELLAGEKVIAPQAARFTRLLRARTEFWKKVRWWSVLLAIAAAPFIIIARTSTPIPRSGTFPAIFSSIDKIADNDFIFSATFDDGSGHEILRHDVPAGDARHIVLQFP